ncbi:MAG: EamA family transporter, partial [Bdellovibrionales bacterium]|nr:EamA family transporter [Bdellovibrionales bacterium]
LRMSVGVVVALLSALCWTGLDTVRKRLATFIAPLPLSTIIGAGMLPFFAAWCVSTEFRLPPAGYIPFAAAAGACGALGGLLFVAAVARSPFSVTIPYLAFSPAVSAIGGLLLGERLSPSQWAGIVSVAIGGFFLQTPRGATPKRNLVVQQFRAFREEPGVRLMLGAAVCWGLLPVCDKFALTFTSAAIHGLFVSSAAVAFYLAALWHRRAAHELAAAGSCWASCIVAALLSTAALGLQLTAIQMIPVAFVETIKRTVGLLSATLIGRLAFAEPITVRAVLCTGVMGLGVALLLLT